MKASLTVPPWFFFALFLFSSSFPSLLVPEASCCPGPHECIALDNPGKQHAATSEGLGESSCLTSVAGPLRLNKAPEMEGKKVCLVYLHSYKFVLSLVCFNTEEVYV